MGHLINWVIVSWWLIIPRLNTDKPISSCFLGRPHVSYLTLGKTLRDLTKTQMINFCCLFLVTLAKPWKRWKLPPPACLHAATGEWKRSISVWPGCRVNKTKIQYTHAQSLQSCPALCDLTNHNPPGSSVHGILQARRLEWVAMLSSRGYSRPRDGTRVSNFSFTGRRILYH